MEIARSLIETLKSLCRTLEDARVDHCLIGGLAVGILGKPRATEDIDMLVLIDEAQMPSLMSRLREHLKVIREGHVMHFPDATIWRTVIGSPTTSHHNEANVRPSSGSARYCFAHRAIGLIGSGLVI
jgi:hypothetical protein